MDIWAAFRLVLVQVKCTAAPVFVQSFVYACGSASTLAKVSRDEFEAWPPTCLTLAMPLTLRFFFGAPSQSHSLSEGQTSEELTAQ
jgi:hypothetical protein